MQRPPITVEAIVNAPAEKVWHDYTAPEAIKAWNAASPDWHTTRVENDLRTDGTFSYRMEAKDGSEGFDLEGVYDEVIPGEKLAYTMSDGREVVTTFSSEGNGIRVTTAFEPEGENTLEVQAAGWQAILDSFKEYSEV